MFIVFFFNDTATTEIYTLSLHDALPIYASAEELKNIQEVRDIALSKKWCRTVELVISETNKGLADSIIQDRKSTRLNSSHANISYAVFCLKKKINLTISLFYNVITSTLN